MMGLQIDLGLSWDATKKQINNTNITVYVLLYIFSIKRTEGKDRLLKNCLKLLMRIK